MRIVFDEDHDHIFALVRVVTEFLTNNCRTEGQMRCMTKYSYGIDRVEVNLVREQIAKFFSSTRFQIGKDCYHAHNIGNNNRYTVYFAADGELQFAGYLNLIDNMYGSVLVYVTDHLDHKRTSTYRLSRYGCSVER